jgi:ATP phosphoribosyltransferase regulatory subunit
MYLQKDEQVIYSLRELYRRYGYRQYKVTKFEEYELYARNKNFLVSDKMLTFTDTNGKLMALKPDVTLSIVKNARPAAGHTDKVYYCENVYRAGSDYNGFQEITQTGLECLGAIDGYTVCEVMMLACRSLASITEKYLLQISHLGFVDALLSKADPALHSEILGLISQKNVAGLRKLNIAPALTETFVLLADTFGPLHQMLPTLQTLADSPQTRAAYEELSLIDGAMAEYGLSDKVYLDFSIVSDLNYYNGIVFQGYVDGLPTHILSGGRYDRLAQKLGKPMGGIGFGVYVSLLERFWAQDSDEPELTLPLRDDPLDTIRAVEALTAQGKRVRAAGKDGAV